MSLRVLRGSSTERERSASLPSRPFEEPKAPTPVPLQRGREARKDNEAPPEKTERALGSFLAFLEFGHKKGLLKAGESEKRRSLRAAPCTASALKDSPLFCPSWPVADLGEHSFILLTTSKQ